MTKKIISISLLTLALLACVKEKASEKEPVVVACAPVSFAADVQPIFQARCNAIGCHHTSTSSDGVALTNYTEVNSVNEDRLLGSIKHEGGYDAMPQGGSQLNSDDINKIECWIKDGKQNN